MLNLFRGIFSGTIGGYLVSLIMSANIRDERWPVAAKAQSGSTYKRETSAAKMLLKAPTWDVMSLAVRA
jgi:hypothetical protein